MSILRSRFDEELDDELRRFSSSLAVDLGMAAEDIAGSRAHAEMLGAVGIIDRETAEGLCSGLQEVLRQLAAGEWCPDDSEEDIHMAVEARLTEVIGEAAGFLHTARSRNDQVATAVRLWLKTRLLEIGAALGELIGVLLDRVETDGQVLMPGYTHLQRGQPVLLGHHLLAHAWALSRDRERLGDALARVDRSPLGACAMAGTSHPIDRQRTADRLGFAGVVENAMDAVSARDHLQEAAATCAVAMVNLSRMAEEVVLWSSAEFAFVRVSESLATGSSIMPQKRNPDPAELVRGKAATVIAGSHGLMSLVKGLPLAYNRDLQEERAALFGAVADTLASIRMMTALWAGLEVERERFEAELVGDPCLATELADLLVERGVPFRRAHQVVGGMVRWCEERGGGLELLTTEDGSTWHPDLPEDLGPWLDPRAAAERKTSRGGTAWCEVQRQVALLRETLSVT